MRHDHHVQQNPNRSRCGCGADSPGRVGSIAAALIAVLALLSVATPAQAAWYNAGWQYRKLLTIDYTRVGATLSNFPVLVSLATDTDLAADAQDDGDDILFTSSDGTTKLDHEIELFNGTTDGKLVAWVKIPSLSNAADTQIYMYYGNSSTTSQQSATAVWNDGGSNYYKGVWHLSNNSFNDSTSYANNGTNNGTTNAAAGKIANARDFENSPTANNQYISVAHNASLQISDFITVEAWVNPETVGVWETIVSKMTGTTEDLYFVLDDSTSSLYAGLAGAFADWDTGVNVPVSSWRHVALTYDGANRRAYLNGSNVATVATTGTLSLGSNTNPLYIGYNTGWTNEQWDGLIDEVRISRTARSPQWISTEFNNQDNPGPGSGAFFKSLGSEEEVRVEQEGFRFRLDDGSESGATWLATQDANISRDKNLNTRLRVLINAATNDPPSTQYQLEYKKSTDSVWSKVPTSAAAPDQTITLVGNATGTTASTATTSPVANLPSGVQSGHLLLAWVVTNGSNSLNSIAGWNQIGTTLTNTADSSVALLYRVATGTEGSSWTFTNLLTTSQTNLIVITAWSGVNTSNPINTFASAAGSALLTSISGPSVTPNHDNTVIIQFLGADPTTTAYSATPDTSPVGTEIYDAKDSGSYAYAAIQYYLQATQAALALDYTGLTSDYYGAFQVALSPAIGTVPAISLSASANISASGENTTAQLTPPSGKTTSNFTTGRIQDDENPADAVDIANAYYTELEWSLIATATAQYGDVYQFRVTANGATIPTYSVTPQWTIQTGGDTSPPTPNPMTFASAPADVSATQISMTATTASDPSTPVEYLFTFTACGSNGGTGGTSSSWQSSTFYSDSGLEANKCYGYTVQARDSLLNTGTASSVSSTYTSAAVPGTPTLSGATATTLNLTNAENGNPSSSPTTYFAVQVVTTSPNDATWLNQWVNVSGNPSATAVWLTDAQLDALVLQGLTASTTYGVKVKARNQDGDETALSAEGQGTTLSAANLDQIHTRWRNDDGPEVNIRVNSGHTVYNSGGSLLNHVITTPPHSPGDVIYIAFAVDQVQTITWPTGFTGGQDDIEATATWGVAYKVAGASEPSTYTVSVGISERAVAIAWSTSNDGGIDANSTPNGGSGATATCNAATTTVANDLVFRMVATDNSVATVTHAPLTDYTMLDQVTLQSGASLSVQFTTQASIGSTGTADVTITSEEWGSATMAIRPAAGPAPATWAANQDTKLTGLAKGTPRRVRFEVSNEGGTASAGVTYQLQVAQTATCSSGTYTAVPTGTTDHWQIVGSSYITDGEATINMASGLTDESSTFIAGQLKDAGNTTSSITLNANEFTEIEFAVQATTNATDGANYCFRLTNNGAALTTYDKYAEATLAAAPANLDQIHTRWRNDDGGEASGAIVVDATRSGSGTTTPLTISHPTGSGANRLMLVGVSINNDNLETVSSITYNGVGLTFVGYANNTRSGNDDARVEIWQLVAPPSGTYNVIINFSAAPALGAIVGVMTFAGVDQSTPLGTFAANENDGYTATVDVTSASNELVFGVVGTEYGTITTDPGQTERWNINIPTPDTHGAGSTKAGAAGSVTLTWALDTSLSNHWAAAGISIKPASASGATWAANEDTKLTGLAKSTLKRVRLEVSNEGGLTSGGVTYQLQVAQTSTCGSGTYSAVPTDTSGHWQIVGSTYITDGEATSNIAGGLTDEAATFVAGQLKDAGNTTGSITLAADAFTEIEFAVQATTNATDGANYCFRLYNTTGGAPLTTYSMYAEATLAGGAAALTLGNHFLWQVTNRFNTASPVTDVLFRFNLVRAGTVTVTNLRVNFTTSTGVANGDVTSGELYEDTNNNGLIDDGAAIQTGVTPVGGVLTFTTDFSPGTSGTNYLVRATVANLVVGDTTTFSVGPADIDEVEAGVGEAGSISGATHTRISVSSLYRSVGTTITALASGTSNGLTISGSTATFDSALPNNVGVGDAIQYDSDNNGSIDAIAFIHGRTSSTVYTIKNSAAGAPTATAAKDNDWAIYRAYTTLSNWESQSANSNIDVAVRSQVNPSTNLVTANSQLNVACYGDGPDTTAVTINGWTTGATTYISIFTPYLPSEVGVTQRHSGKWDDTKYRLSAAPAYQSGVLEILEDFVRVEGLQILAEATANTQTDGIGAHCDAIATVSDIRIADNIVRAGGSLGSDAWGIGIWSPSAGGNSPTIRIWNNVVYDFTCSSCAGIGVGSQSTPTAYTYNNTVYNCSYGYYADSGGTIVAKNNIAYNNSDNYSTNSGTFSAASTNNLSGPSPQNDAPGSSPRNAVPVTFVAPGATPRDLHLVSTDTGAKDYGASLSSDPSLAFSDDIDSHSRPYGSAWDIGADEYVSELFDYRRQITVGDAMTPASCGSDLSSFPVLVSISNDAGLKTAANGGHVANANGYDILFRALDGTTELDHEIESFDGSTGTLVAWVRVPSLAYNADTTIYMYYGNAGITTPTANPAGVWGTSYKGVWHLTESGNGTAGEYDDSTQYANEGQGGRGDSRYVPKQTGGQIGFGQQFDNLVDGKYDLVDVGNGSALNITGNQITLEAWVRHDLSAPYAHDSWGFVNRKGWSSGYRLLMQTSGYGCAPLCVHFGLGEGSSFLGTATVLTAGSWHHVVGTYDGSLMRVFIDGLQDANTLSKTAALTAPLPPEDHVWIGYGDQPTDVGWSSEWDGQIDEVRISNVARSACWIETEYNSVQYATNSSYISVGAEGAAGPTAVDLVSLDATAYAGRGVLVSWRTGFEVDNLGFHVYRDQGGERVRVTPSLVAGSALFAGAGTPLTAGQSYSWWDRSPLPGASYWLEEWELSGEKRWHGPVSVQPGVWHAQAQGLSASTSGGSVQGSSPLLAGLGQAASPSLPQGVRRKLRQAVASDEARLAVQWGLASRPAVKVMVSEAGWYRVSQEELVRAGLDPSVDPGSLQLFMDGREVPILVAGGADGGFGAGDGIEFYGEGLETCASGVRVYWLVAGPGAGMRIPEASGGGGWSQGPASFAAEVERADRTLYFPAFLNGEESNFFGAVVTASPVNQTVRVPHVEQAGPGELIVRLVGGTAGAHRVGVELNEVRVGTVVWEGMTVGELAVPVGPGMILEGDNTVTLTAEGGEGDVSAVASIAVRYAHTWQADGDALEFTLGGYQEVTISGFANSQVRVLDITDPWAVQMLPAEVSEDTQGTTVTVGVPEAGERTLLAVGTGAIRHPVGVLPNRPSAWHQATEGADLVIIGHRSLLAAVEPLRSLRESQGLKVAVVDVESVFDEFSYGARDPQAIRAFLACAKERWSRPPRYLLLVGDASFDPRNYLGYGWADLVPTKLVDTTYMETASDDWFADFDGDGIADIPVGRIPVQIASEATTAIGKIVAYDGSARFGRVLLLADANDEENDFEGLSAQVKAAVPSTVWVSEIFRGQVGDAAAKSELASYLNLGQTLVNYLGHGSVAVWHGNWLTTDEARALRNYWYPFVVSMTCLNGYFHEAQQESLAEALLEGPGGAVAVWASSGLTESASQVLIDEALMRALFSGTTTLGDATRAAKAATSDMDVRRTWILFGDPTTKLR